MGGTRFDYMVEAFLDGAWVDLTDYVRSGKISRGVDRFAGVYAKANAGTAMVVLDNTDGRWDPTYASGPHYGDLKQRVPWRILGPSVSDTSALRCGGVGFAWTEVTSGLNIAGDLDLRIEITPDPEQPRTEGDDPVTLIDNQDSYRFEYVPAADAFRLVVTTSSVEREFVLAPSADNPFTEGTRRWVRVTLDISVATATLYTSTDGSSWTSRATDTQSAVAFIDAGTINVLLGARQSGFPGLTGAGTYQFSGLIHEARILDGIAGTLVGDPDFTGMARTDESVTDSDAQVWAISHGAWVEGGSGRLPLWTGLAEKWAPSFPLGGHDAIVTLFGVDARTLYAGRPFDLTNLLSAATDDDYPGERIRKVVNGAAVSMRLDRGTAKVRALDVVGEDSAAYMQLVADTEGGELAVDSQGRIMFRDRHALLQDTRSTAPQVTFGDDPADSGEKKYAALGLVVDAEQIVNTARVERADDGTDPATEQTYTDSASVDEFGEAGFRRTDLLLLTDTEALDYAAYVVALFANGEDRFDSLMFHPDEPGYLDDETTSRLELGDRISCILRPPYGGTVERDSFVRGIDHEWAEDGAAMWTTRIGLQDASRHDFLVLDDTDRGALDTARLAY